MIYDLKAIRHFSLAGVEARAQRTARVMARSAPPPAPVRVRPDPEPHPEPRPPKRRPVIRLWLPMTAIFLLLSPFALLLAPLIYLAPAPYRARPFATVIGVGRLLLSLGGTVVHVDAPDALVSIRIF